MSLASSSPRHQYQPSTFCSVAGPSVCHSQLHRAISRVHSAPTPARHCATRDCTVLSAPSPARRCATRDCTVTVYTFYCHWQERPQTFSNKQADREIDIERETVNELYILHHQVVQRHTHRCQHRRTHQLQRWQCQVYPLRNKQHQDCHCPSSSSCPDWYDRNG